MPGTATKGSPVELRDDTGATLGISGNPLASTATLSGSLPAGTNNIGDVDVLTLPALPAGTNNIGDVDVLTLPALPAGTNNIGDVDVLTLPALPAGTNNIGDVDILSGPTGASALQQQGAAAHDVALAGNPLRMGARGVSADITAVTTGRTTDLIATLLGKQLNYPYALPGNTWNYAATGGTMNIPDGTYSFRIGWIANGGAGQYFDGLEEQWGLWIGRILSDAEITYIYNSGTGRQLF